MLTGLSGSQLPIGPMPSTVTHERRLLGELADRARAGDLVLGAEPLDGQGDVARVGRTARERDVPGQEAAGPAALDHQQLEPAGAVPPGHDGCRESQFVDHARILPGVDGDILLAMSEQVAEAIRAAIGDHGPITFAEFMQLALYGPGGYYEDPPVGTGGDFVTSPHVHPVFGAMLGTAVDDLSTCLGDPAPLRVAEVGAGDGTLAAQVLGALAGRDVEYEAIDVSAGARETLSAIGGVRVGDALTDAPHVVIANELLDNLPFRRVRGDREVRVGVSGDRFVEVETPWDGEPGPAGVETIVPDGALGFVDRMAPALTRGYALLIDYGDIGTSGGGIHGYRDHRVVGDVLAVPGSTDITAGVDFARIANHAVRRGLIAFPTVTQHDALLALGFEAWLRGELERQTAQIDAREGLDAVRTWSGRSRATLLVDPSALGRLRWLLLATPGLPAPTWLDAAGR